MDAQTHARSGSTFRSLLRHLDVYGGSLAAFFLWYADTKPGGFEELAQAFEDFIAEIGCEESNCEEIELGKSEYHVAD